MYVFVSMYTTYVPDAHISWKRVSGPLELELQAFVNCHVGVKNQTQILWKRNECP